MTAQNSMQGGNFGFGPISAGFSFGGGTDLDASVKLMGAQSSFWKKNTRWLNENGWQMMRQGLINGDYNPILAVSRDPMSGAMPNVTATEGTVGINGSYDQSASANAQSQRMQTNATVSNLRANTAKTNEEAKTQESIRQNYDMDTALKQMDIIWKQSTLPYEIKLKASEILLNNARANESQVTAKYVPTYAQNDTRNSYSNLNSSRNGSWSRIIGSSFGDIKRQLIQAVGNKDEKQRMQKAIEFLNYLR